MQRTRTKLEPLLLDDFIHQHIHQLNIKELFIIHAIFTLRTVPAPKLKKFSVIYIFLF